MRLRVANNAPAHLVGLAQAMQPHAKAITVSICVECHSMSVFPIVGMSALMHHGKNENPFLFNAI